MEKQKSITDKIKDFYNQKPVHMIELTNGKLHYRLNIHRKLTIVRGDSGIGKTTFLHELQKYRESILPSEINNSKDFSVTDMDVKSSADYIVNPPIIQDIEKLNVEIYLFDDSHIAVRNVEVLKKLMNSEKFVVIVSREAYTHLTYSISEIYSIYPKLIGEGHVNKYKYDNRIDRIYKKYIIKSTNQDNVNINNINTIIVEDSKTGFSIFKKIFSKYNITVISTHGRNNIIKVVKERINNSTLSSTLIVFDSVNFGSDIDDLLDMIGEMQCNLLPYESFEFIVLESLSIFDNVADILNTNLSGIIKQLPYNLEYVYNSLLKKAVKRTNINIQNEKVDILDYMLDNIKIQKLGQNISYSKSRINNKLFTEDVLNEIESGIIQCIIRNPKQYTHLNSSDSFMWR